MAKDLSKAISEVETTFDQVEQIANDLKQRQRGILHKFPLFVLQKYINLYTEEMGINYEKYD